MQKRSYARYLLEEYFLEARKQYAKSESMPMNELGTATKDVAAIKHVQQGLKGRPLLTKRAWDRGYFAGTSPSGDDIATIDYERAKKLGYTINGDTGRIRKISELSQETKGSAFNKAIARVHDHRISNPFGTAKKYGHVLGLHGRGKK